ncbi:MAG: double-strand break repair protein AddB [Aestuariivirga sp.]
MDQPSRVFTIPSDAPFLAIVAQAVLDGFPAALGARPTPLDIARVRILVPTRRAARALERMFFDINGGRGLLLPRISPIGDIDEELFGFLDSSAPLTDVQLPDAISPIGRELILMDLIAEWAKTNPQERLAAEIEAAPRQSVALAVSLGEFLDSLETEDIDPARLAGLYGIESARHREAILGFLALIRERLPARLSQRQLLGPKARRSLLLRSEARRLAENPPSWPVIAAGSTGSIPASRELLATIARLPTGAVILPGLDTGLDEASWLELGPQHPQFILKQFLTDISLAREEVHLMPGCSPGGRQWLASEIMRPPATSEKWRNVVATQKDSIARALDNVEVVEARSVAEEATIISLVLRQALETPGKTASLMTSDRELARRVKQELANRSVDIDDSAGEPLIRLGPAAFLALLIDLILGGCTPEKLLAFFKHDLCRFGFASGKQHRAVAVIELAVFRAGFGAPALGDLAAAIAQAQTAARSDPFLHPAIKNLNEADWAAAADYANRSSACLLPLVHADERLLGEHLKALIAACELAAGGDFWTGEEADTLKSLTDRIMEEGNFLACGFATAATLIRHYLSVTMFRRMSKPKARLTILGLLEARLMRPDLMVLGGLNEGRWPAAPDPGPWLNRPMRQTLGMQQPERDIGQEAHDFVQALGCGEVCLTWSRRVGDAPSIPSRWILRLQMLVKAAELTATFASSEKWQALAAGLDEPGAVRPCERPKPRPPVEARPKRLSVTRVETLIRDPYALYSRQVLGLHPLEEISAVPDMAERGSLFHQAIGEFLTAFPKTLPPDALDHLLRLGKQHFTPLLSNPDVETFWWPQFVRIAHWFIAEEIGQRQGVDQIYSEIDGRTEFAVAGLPFTLTCRADRIDVLADGTARIIDYKTGKVPTAPQVAAGLAPQLTLQAAMLADGAFPELGKRQSREIAYVKLSAGDPPGEVIIPKLESIMDCAREHMAGLMSLLTAYADPQQAYLPRVMMEKEDDAGDCDHFSRYREWAVSGGGA